MKNDEYGVAFTDVHTKEPLLDGSSRIWEGREEKSLYRVLEKCYPESGMCMVQIMLSVILSEGVFSVYYTKFSSEIQRKNYVIKVC